MVAGSDQQILEPLHHAGLRTETGTQACHKIRQTAPICRIIDKRHEDKMEARHARLVELVQAGHLEYSITGRRPALDLESVIATRKVVQRVRTLPRIDSGRLPDHWCK